MSNEARAREAGVSYGEYLRGHGVRVAYSNSVNGWDATKQKRWDRENEAYRNAVKSGLEPETVSMAAVRKAEDAAAKG